MYTAVKPLSKYLQLKSVRIYDAIFTLHSKCTCALLLAFTLLLSSKQYFGDPLVCVSEMAPMEYVNSHCWIMGTYIMDYDRAELSKQLNNTRKEHDESAGNTNMEISFEYNVAVLNSKTHRKRIYQRYYQWVVPVLLLQSFVFYLPAFLWKIWEGGRLKNLCANFENALESQEKSLAHLYKLARYFASDHKETHQRYLISYIFCEVCNFGISIINMLLLDVFLNGFWSQYVEALAAVPAYDWDAWNRIVTHIFPKIAKCEILKYGASGSQEYRDSLCLLPLNNLNEKIFVFLWVWFILIAILAGIKLLYRVCIIFNRGLRYQLLRTQSRFLPMTSLKRALGGFSCGDWFILMRVSNNISPELFSNMLNLLDKEKCTESKSIALGMDAA